MRAAVTVPCEAFRSAGMSIGLIVLACAPAGIRAAATDPQPVPQITIEARRQALEPRVRTFVHTLSHSRRFSAESVPRWGQPLCFEVAGFRRQYAEFVAARLSQVAASVGVPLLEAGCARDRANFYVLFTPNPAESLRYLDRHPWRLFPQNAPRPQIDRFMNPPKSVVVRVWHNAEFVGSSAVPLAAEYAPGFSMPGVLTNFDDLASIRLPAVQSFTTTLVVIDSTRIQDIQIGQLSDYVAMVGLVDVDVDDNLRDAPSILRLFTAPSGDRPQGLTEWDRAFLTALYHTDQGNRQQRGQIVTMMVDEMAH